MRLAAVLDRGGRAREAQLAHALRAVPVFAELQERPRQLGASAHRRRVQLAPPQERGQADHEQPHQEVDRLRRVHQADHRDLDGHPAHRDAAGHRRRHRPDPRGPERGEDGRHQGAPAHHDPQEQRGHGEVHEGRPGQVAHGDVHEPDDQAHGPNDGARRLEQVHAGHGDAEASLAHAGSSFRLEHRTRRSPATLRRVAGRTRGPMHGRHLPRRPSGWPLRPPCSATASAAALPRWPRTARRPGVSLSG